jgi:hypothetical protein
LDSVAGGQFAGVDLLEVKVTISNTLSGNFSLTVQNTSSENSYTGPSGDRARINFALPTFTFGAQTLDSSFTGIAVTDFTVASPVLELNLAGVTIDPNGQTFTSGISIPTVTSSKLISSIVWSGYQGTGTFNFDVDGEFEVATVISQANVFASQTLGDSEFTATVEYLVAIPEPRAYAVIVGLIGLGLILIKRRNRKA